VILGLNGWVWVSAGTGASVDGDGQGQGNGGQEGDGFGAEGVYSNTNDVSCARWKKGGRADWIGNPT
jgi:exosome complex component RRP4